MNKLALQQKAPVIILVLLITAMLLTLALQAYEFFMPINSQSQEQAIKSQTVTTQQPRPERKIDQFELFGTPTDPNQQAAAVKTEDLPKTNLRLMLRGVSASTKLDRASALIEGPDKETLKYAVNDTLPGNAKLKSVHEKRIVIERNGRLENLYFPDDVSIGIVRNDTTNATSQHQAQSKSPKPLQAPQLPQNYARPAANLDTLSEERKKEIKHRLEQLREKMKQTPQ